MPRGDQPTAIAGLARRAGGPRRRYRMLLHAAAVLSLSQPSSALAHEARRGPGSTASVGATHAIWLVPFLPTPALSGHEARSHRNPRRHLALEPAPAGAAPPARPSVAASVPETRDGLGCSPGDLECPLEAEPTGLTRHAIEGRDGDAPTPPPVSPGESATGGAEAPVPPAAPSQPQAAPPGGTAAPTAPTESTASPNAGEPHEPALGSPESARRERQRH